MGNSIRDRARQYFAEHNWMAPQDVKVPILMAEFAESFVEQKQKLCDHFAKLAGWRWDRIIELETKLAALYGSHRAAEDALSRLAAAQAENARKDALPVDMILFCPKCHFQHIDEPTPEVCKGCGHTANRHSMTLTDQEFRHDTSTACGGCWNTSVDLDSICDVFIPWLNPPHKKHRCLRCNHVWKPANIATNGVADLATAADRTGRDGE